MGFKDFLFEHPVATVFLGWSGVDVVRVIANAINREQHRRHLERVGKIRVDAVNSGKMTREEAIEKIPYEELEVKTEEKKEDPEKPEDNKEGEEDS